MAFWVLGGSGGATDEALWHQPGDNGRSRGLKSSQGIYQRPGGDFRDDEYMYNSNQNAYTSPCGSEPGSIQIKNLAFLVIREQRPDQHNEEEVYSRESTRNFPRKPHLVERTQSGLSIASDTSTGQTTTDDVDDEVGGPFIDDIAAAKLVREHITNFQRRFPDSQHARILRILINPKSSQSAASSSATMPPSNESRANHDFPLDNDALRSVFSAANELFFANRLSRRVAWDWSHEGSTQYRSAVVGTTALRRSARLGGWETLIVLSSPVLRDTRYNRRLLIATFLHEMIHSFLFVTCGIRAGRDGGHTEGFRQIAEVIDQWVGRDQLRLGDMEADLEYFRGDCCGKQGQQQQMMFGNPEEESDDGWFLDRESNVWPRRGDGFLSEPVQPPPRQFRHADDGGWQWYEREGFEAHDGPEWPRNSLYSGT
ncbi:hypothetical protein K4F52_003652 [Lecanicillium sp. MT-2017a]|nr:hypothetical protein K4F52_003652 [Lecanicillium sp. MT-2017a]